MQAQRETNFSPSPSQHAHSESDHSNDNLALQVQLSSLNTLSPNQLAIIAAACNRKRKRIQKGNRVAEQEEMKEEAANDDGNEDDEDEDSEQDNKHLMDTLLPVSSSSLTVGAPPEFRIRIIFGLIPKWIYIISLLFFTLMLQDFADTLAGNAERLQEMEFFTGMDCDGIDPIPDQCIRGTTQQKTVENLKTGASVVLMFILSPFFGALVDIYGRRPLFIFSIAIQTIDHVFTLLRWLIPGVFTYYYIIIWQILIISIQLGVSETIISDVVPPQHRSIFIGASIAVIQISDLILPQVSIHLEPHVAFPATAVLGAAALFFSFLMPETLLEKYHTVKKFSWSAASPMKAFSLLLRYRILTLLALIMFILGFTLSAAGTLTDGAIGFRFPSSPQFQANEQTIVGSIQMLSLTLVQYILLRFLSQRQVMLISTLCLLIAIIGSATMTAAWQIYIWSVPLATVEMFAPIVTQIVSQYVEHEEFGSVMTAMITLESFGNGIGSQLCLPLYLFWSPPPGTDGLSAGGSMTYFPQILFGTICGLLCVMVWQLEPPSEGEKADYRRAKKRRELEAAAQETEAATAQSSVASIEPASDVNENLLTSSSLNIDGGDRDASAVSVDMTAMHQPLLSKSTEKRQFDED